MLLAISFLIKAVLLFLLPLIIFSFCLSSFSKLQSGLFLFTVLLLSLMCFSNFLAVISSYYFTISSQNIVQFSTITTIANHPLTPKFHLPLEPLVPNSLGLIVGIILGIYTSHSQNKVLVEFANRSAIFANKFLQKIFIPLLPIFILGFALKMQEEGVLLELFRNFLPLIVMLLVLYIIYIGGLYIITFNFNLKRATKALANILPAAIVGFSTMSSAASLPVLSSCASKNTQDGRLTQTVIPAIINTHMIGDALGIPLIALSVYFIEYKQFPDFISYFYFSFGYVLAKFAAAGVPGGTIIIMIPVFEKSLGFSPELSSIILMMYLLFDPFCTMGNIFGNGLFAIVFEKLWHKIRPRNSHLA